MAKKYTSKFTGQEIDNILTEAQEHINIVEDKQLQKVTYDELKNLRDNRELVSGGFYRITDYECTTVQENTKSAGHNFDIIVRADDINVLNETAWAIHHEGDTYFETCDLSAWELKYCLDNDSSRFAWADESGKGKGVIYYMKDEFGNECPYDFKNIQYIVGASYTSEGEAYYTFSFIPGLTTSTLLEASVTSSVRVTNNIIKPYFKSRNMLVLNNNIFQGFVHT
jgi:hypothetical protein